MTVDVRSLLVLSQVPGVGPHRLRALVNACGSAEQALAASVPRLESVEGIDRRTAGAIHAFAGSRSRREAERTADAQIARLELTGGFAVTWWDDAYPRNLKTIYDPPPLLYVRGTLDAADASSIAIVGTRSPSAAGTAMAERFAEGFASLGITVVSGLARGVDTHAHGACLRGGGRTLAVIGSGIDVLYPAENTLLAERIGAHGAVISEYAMGTKPDAQNFPRRNRIISGITLGTVVIETGLDGGALITATAALEQNREVFAIPSAVLDHAPSGCNRLIHDGHALLVERIEDVLDVLAPRLRIPLTKPAAPVPELSLFERTVYDACPGDGPVHVDVLAATVRLPVAELLGHLLTLELKGVIRQLPGKFFVKS